MTRLIDILLSSLAIFFLIPLCLPIILTLRLTGEKEIFYLQKRIGRRGDSFGLFKFATMLKESPNLKNGSVTVKNDPRVLPFGKVLRATKINELPQLLNVILGHMSLIGPRPLTPELFNQYSPEVKKTIMSVRPGLSGVGSIIFRDEARLLSNKKEVLSFYTSSILPYKGELEKWYVQNKSLGLDIKLILLTVLVIFKPSFRLVSWFIKGLPKPMDKELFDLLFE